MELSNDLIMRLIIEPLSDAGVITDYAEEYGEPGYDFDHPSDTERFLIGDWWCKCGKNPRAGRNEYEKPDSLHSIDTHHPRVWQQLYEQGVECAFYDEWTVIHCAPSSKDPNMSCSKAYRTQPDSYSWQSSIRYSENAGDYLTPDDDIEYWIESMSVPGEHPDGVLPANIFNESDILGAGFERFHEPGSAFEDYRGETTTYESGWHPGQDADPKEIAERIWAEHPGAQILFFHVEQSQFYSRFAAYWRPDPNASEEE